MDNLENRKHYISWPVLALMAFVTVIGFDDLIYNFKNQGMGVITSWILMLFLYVIPYSLMVGQLGSVFNKEGGGLSSWIRGTNGEFLGYFTAWTYWAASIPYVVDTANSVVVGLGWAINGSGKFQDDMSNSQFALWTLLIFVVFIMVQSRFKRSLELLSSIGGIAMFGMTVLFVVMAISSLGMGGHIATQPMNLGAIIPKFDLKYLTTVGLLIYAVNGCELIAPFVTKMKKPRREFPKSMLMLVVMTAFLTIFGSFSLGIFFDAHHLPHDLKMNGSYYAFQALGQQYHVGNLFMYLFAWTEVIYLAALLAVLLDAMTRMLISDTGQKYMPRFLRKKNRAGLPINGYLLTCFLSGFILFLGIFLPEMNDVFNWLLNLNGIISPGVTCWIFYAFMRVRKNPERYPSEYVFIKNNKLAWTVGFWALMVTAVATIFGIAPQDVAEFSSVWWHELIINVVAIVVLIGLGALLPLITKREEKYGLAFSRLQWILMLLVVVITVVLGVYLGSAKLADRNLLVIGDAVIGIALVCLLGWRRPK
ncbi:APC family permease [Liquorilactobacillus capillatus]|uniref:APC family amino acid transporter n=1 Tax=Liquorilactobacillus capillatus DSM 19910 TaxID=1423731 RepID=A0A0R1M2C4_9LACO|nr:amino acid permease [Liquorilactobacillus capillatus]KRL02128.1 APC family amino acid transporter [Liquorilactobacillus capillatus DSM 19910]